MQRLDLSSDAASILSFADDTRLEQARTHDLALLEQAIDRIETGGGTDIAEALTMATEEFFAGTYDPTSLPALLLLTDGRVPNVDETLAASEAAKARGVRIITIGLGTEIDETLLREIASDAATDYWYAPTAEELSEIYRKISQQLDCEKDDA